MKIYLLFLAILPVSCFMIWIYYKDKYDKESILTLVKYFLVGILVSILCIFIELYFNYLNIFNGLASYIYVAFFVTAFTEEGVKSIILIPMLLREKHFNEKLDGIIYSIFLSLGFATIENIIYLMRERIDLLFSLFIAIDISFIIIFIFYYLFIFFYLFFFFFYIF